MQEQLGHKDAATTMIYAYVLSRRDVHVRSSLDQPLSLEPALQLILDEKMFAFYCERSPNSR